MNTPYQNNAHYCDVLRQNTKRLFRILGNPTRIKTWRRIIYAAFQFRAGSYRIRRANLQTSNNWHNLQQRNTTTRLRRLDIVCRSQPTVRDVYLALEKEAAKYLSFRNISELSRVFRIFFQKNLGIFKSS
jgi:hypothetical protein